jgi:integrase
MGGSPLREAANKSRIFMASYRKRGRVWYFRYVDAEGVKRTVKGCPDRRVTEEMARDAETQAAKIRSGRSDPRAERIAREARRPVREHIAEFVAGMESKGDGRKHVRSTRTYLERVISLAGIGRITDLTPSSVLQAVAVIKAEGRSARAVNAYLAAAKSFSRWLKRDGRAADYALETLVAQNVQADRRRIRRALAPEEAARVIQAAARGPEAGGLSGPDRAMLYDLALGTGFRAEELATLTPERFALGADPPTVTVLAGYAKNGREAIQPVAVALAGRLRPWLARKAPGRPVFGGMTKKAAGMLRVDLEAAGVPYKTASGVADFHALRVAYVSNLVASGASVKVCQVLACHSSPALTFGVYAKAALHDIRGAVENLPDLTPATPTPAEPLAMTGTDPAVTPISKGFGHHLAPGGDVPGHHESLRDVMTPSDAPACIEEKPPVSGGIDASGRSESSSVANVPPRTRADDPLISLQRLGAHERARSARSAGLRHLPDPAGRREGPRRVGVEPPRR